MRCRLGMRRFLDREGHYIGWAARRDVQQDRHHDANRDHRKSNRVSRFDFHAVSP